MIQELPRRKLVIQNGVAVEMDMTPEEIAVEAPTVPEPKVLTALAFLESFLPDERIAIRAAARGNAGLEDWLDMLRVAQEISLDDPRTVSGVNAMVNAGLLTPRRRDALLGTPRQDELPETPPRSRPA